MFYLILTILFIAVFAFIFWRVIAGTGLPKEGEPTATYVCPLCNELDCECHQVNDVDTDKQEKE